MNTRSLGASVWAIQSRGAEAWSAMVPAGGHRAEPLVAIPTLGGPWVIKWVTVLRLHPARRLGAGHCWRPPSCLPVLKAHLLRPTCGALLRRPPPPFHPSALCFPSLLPLSRITAEITVSPKFLPSAGSLPPATPSRAPVPGSGGETGVRARIRVTSVNA